MRRLSDAARWLMWSERNDENLASIEPGAMEGSRSIIGRSVPAEDEKRRKGRVEKKLESKTECINALKRALQGVAEAHAEITAELRELPKSEFHSSVSQVNIPDTKGGVLLSEATPAVGTLLFRIEQCIFHGLLSDTDFYGVHPFWALLGCVERSIESENITSDEEKLRSSIQEVAAAINLNTALERAQAWIREALRVEALAPFIFAVTKQNSLLHEFYDSRSIMHCSQTTDILHSTCIDLTSFDFSNVSLLPPSAEVEKTEVGGSTYSPCSLAFLNGTQLEGSMYPRCVCTPGALSPLIVPATPDTESKEMQQSPTISVKNFEGQDSPLSGFGSPATPHDHEPSTKFNPSDPMHAHNSFPRQKLFGTDIKAVLLDPRHSLWGNLEPRICIPDAIESLLDKLTHPSVVKTPGLLRIPVMPSQVIEVVRFIEKKNTVPKKADGHLLGAVLLLYLYNLPQPLLTYDLYDAFVSCGKVLHEGRATEEQITKRIRELLSKLPWAHRPLLVKLMYTVDKLLDVENAEENGLSISRLSPLLGSAILRPYGYKELRKEKDSDPSLLDARNRVGSILIQNHEVVLDYLRVEQNMHLLNLQNKLRRVMDIQSLFSSRVYLKDDTHTALLVTIWANLDCARPLDSSEVGVHEEHDGPESLPALIDPSSSDASRWVTFGFCKSIETMHREFYACGSILVLDCLAYFMQAYPETATRFFTSAKTTSFPDISMLERGKEVLKIVVDCLELFPPPSAGSIRRLKGGDTLDLGGQKKEPESELGLRLSRGKNCSLFNDYWIVQEVFVACLLLLERLEEKSLISQKYNYDDALKAVRKALTSTLSVTRCSVSSMFKALQANSGISLFLDEEKSTVGDYNFTANVASTTTDDAVKSAPLSATTYPNQSQGIPTDEIVSSHGETEAMAVNVEAAKTRGEEKGIEPCQTDNSSPCEGITHLPQRAAVSNIGAICQPQDLGILEERILAQWNLR